MSWMKSTSGSSRSTCWQPCITFTPKVSCTGIWNRPMFWSILNVTSSYVTSVWRGHFVKKQQTTQRYARRDRDRWVRGLAQDSTGRPSWFSRTQTTIKPLTSGPSAASSASCSWILSNSPNQQKLTRNKTRQKVKKGKSLMSTFSQAIRASPCHHVGSSKTPPQRQTTMC